MAFDLREKLKKSSRKLTGSLGALFGGSPLSEDELEEAEEILLGSDLGWELTEKVIDDLPSRMRKSGKDWKETLAEILMEETAVPEKHLRDSQGPMVTVVIGVNGAGKTTTIARLAYRRMEEGGKVLLACADTFRAAAAEQLETWAQRLGTAVLTQMPGSDAGAVAFDAVKRGLSRGYDSVIIDTAGRLPNKKGLLDELTKIYRVCGKAMEGAPHEVLLVLDGTVGQNAKSQAEQFMKAMPVTGLVVTKLDGTARGGSVLAMSGELELPVEYIGVGEGRDDLMDFRLEDFVYALLDMDRPG
ncbi:MAG: signal recognition particle-docking protein FtsY [Candidatus Aegiribacteria sp.]|nr:signal recognition particle-docking protein FtsY [Candidatus Aegiribacteria sp.]MBD3295197.1 signal recognition particle-docking protein FtsY [Candidatus Fermentibacteria bacterium]